jgi:hypothetical protein
MSERRTNEDDVQCAGSLNVIDEAAIAHHQGTVCRALQRTPDLLRAVLCACRHSLPLSRPLQSCACPLPDSAYSVAKDGMAVNA